MIKKHKLDGITGDRLQQLHDAPVMLFYKGVNPNDLLTRPSVAIVGARKMTAYGNTVTQKLATELARAGVVVISGLALGVDSAAHRAVLEADGLTIAVLPSGPNNVYPTSHHGLAQSILDNGGTLVSEYESDFPAMKHTFIARNRIIAAMADAVLVTEAAIKSGSLHTAGFALDLGKPVLAVPGPITSDQSAGTNQLIKTGAVPVTSVQDIFDALGLTAGNVQQSFAGLTQPEQAILTALKNGSSEGAALLVASKLNSGEFAQTLTMLEISGRVRALGGDLWALT